MTNVILIESLEPSECNIIQESSTDGKNLWLNGICMQSGIKNRNGRVYPINEISSAVDIAQKGINEGQLMGELDHPNNLSINLDRVSHLITEMSMSGNNAMTKLKILTTPMGVIAKTLIDSGVRPGLSSRGAGQVNEEGNVSDFLFTTVDIVAQPSAPGAVPSSIYESLQSNDKGKEVLSLAESLQHDDSAQKYFKKAILTFLSENLFAKK